MKILLLLLSLYGVAQAGAAGMAELNLPPCYNQARQQIFRLELKDLPANRIVLDHPCTVSVAEDSLVVTNGRVAATLMIDIQSTPATFPLVVMAVDANGRQQELRKLMCHLSLVPDVVMVQFQGNEFIISNLTDRPLEIEGSGGVHLVSHDNSRIRGTVDGRGWIRLKSQGLVELIPHPRKESQS